jgi:hypothetical protein
MTENIDPERRRHTAGVTVKAQRRPDPETGVAVGRNSLDIVSLAQVLAPLRRLAGARRIPRVQ